MKSEKSTPLLAVLLATRKICESTAKANREDLTLSVPRLRGNAQRLGLIRKIKGRLTITSAVNRLLDDPAGLWLFLARAIAHGHCHDSQCDAVLLLLLEVAAGKRIEWENYDCNRQIIGSGRV